MSDVNGEGAASDHFYSHRSIGDDRAEEKNAQIDEKCGSSKAQMSNVDATVPLMNMC